jgi:hypothetical protein
MTNTEALDKLMDVSDYVAFQLDGDLHQRFDLYKRLREVYADLGKLNGGLTEKIEPKIVVIPEPPKRIVKTLRWSKKKGRGGVREQQAINKKLSTEVDFNPWERAIEAPYDQTLQWVTATGLIREGKRSKAKVPYPNENVYVHRVPAPGTFRGKFWRKKIT